LDSFSLNTQTLPIYHRLSSKDRKKFLDELKNHKLDYEDNKKPHLSEILDLAPKAFDRFERKRSELNFKTNTRLLIKVSETQVLKIVFGEKWELCSLVKEINHPGFVLIGCDTKLLFLLLQGPRFAHWNNAEIGSLLSFQRVPDIYERNIYYCLYYFHA